jgi:hypothetical protein
MKTPNSFKKQRGFLASSWYLATDKVETSMMFIWLVERRMEVEVALLGSGSFELVSSQPDFVNEVTLLQFFHCTEFGASRCHLAGWLSIDADLQPKVSFRPGWRGHRI